MKIIPSVFVTGICLAAAGGALAQANDDGGKAPPTPPPQALTGYATSKAAAPYSANVMAGYGSAKTGYSATAMSGYTGAGKLAAASALYDVGGRAADPDPFQSPDSVKGAKPRPAIVVTDAQGAVWIFDATVNGWRNRSTAALRFTEPTTSPSQPKAGQPAWITTPDRPN